MAAASLAAALTEATASWAGSRSRSPSSPAASLTFSFSGAAFSCNRLAASCSFWLAGIAPEIVDDVNADDRYLACFVSTRSEIVVPIAYEGRVVGEIDIDSDVPAAFGPEDRTFLERVALLISPHCLVGWDTGGTEWTP